MAIDNTYLKVVSSSEVMLLVFMKLRCVNLSYMNFVDN